MNNTYDRITAEIATGLAEEAGIADDARFSDGGLMKFVFIPAMPDVSPIVTALYDEGWNVTTDAVRWRITVEDISQAASRRVAEATASLAAARERLEFITVWAAQRSSPLTPKNA